ncbi:hypothetical protein PAMP_018596 [Pampus punctatissimus]
MVTPTILRFALPSSERDRPAVAVAAVVKRDKRSMSASSEESMGSWSHITPEDDPHEETSSFIQLSEGEETEKGHLAGTKENIFPCLVTFDLSESGSARTASSSSNLRELLVVNCDLEPECVDSELRVALQWIAASELGLPTLYFRKSKEKRVAKFQRVIHLMSQKAWQIADLFGAVVQFCKVHEKEEAEGRSLSSLFDWLLENL